MEAQGDDLTISRDVDFNVVFPDQDSAESFATHFRSLGYKASAEFAEVAESLSWDVLIVNRMVPSHQQITDFEDLLQSIANKLGGRNDGWGCISSQSSESSSEPN